MAASSVVTGSPDIGGSRTACAMIAAEELVIPVPRHKVRRPVADTDSIGYTDVTGGQPRGRWRPASPWYEAEGSVRQAPALRASPLGCVRDRPLEDYPASENGAAVAGAG